MSQWAPIAPVQRLLAPGNYCSTFRAGRTSIHLFFLTNMQPFAIDCCHERKGLSLNGEVLEHKRELLASGSGTMCENSWLKPLRSQLGQHLLMIKLCQ